MTDACVLSTAFDAANRDFRVIVPQGRGAVASRRRRNIGALQVISLHLGLVVDAPALLAEYFARDRLELPVRTCSRNHRHQRGHRRAR